MSKKTKPTRTCEGKTAPEAAPIGLTPNMDESVSDSSSSTSTVSTTSTVVDALTAKLKLSTLEQKEASVSPMTLKEEQNARSLLRERYLYLLSRLCQSNKRVKIQMYEGTKASGKLKATDRIFGNIVIENLIVPYPNPDIPVPLAILRTDDIMTIEFDRDDDLLND